MKVFILSLVLIFSGIVVKADERDVIKQLQNVSVTIKAKGAEGSGFIKTRVVKVGDKEETVSFCWTAAHVVDGLRHTRVVIDTKTGTSKTIVEFDDASIVQELNENGRRVGEVKMDAEIIKFSNADTGEDLALLRIRKRNFVDKNISIQFYLEDNIPQAGENLFHVGSLLGQMGANSLTTGIISQQGRVLSNGKVFDQSSAVAFPGSSGGLLSLKSDGRCVGMLVRGAGEGFNLFVPVRRIRDWAKKTGIEFALDDKFPVPSDDELRKSMIEDNEFQNNKIDGVKSIDGTRFMIRETSK